MRTSRPILLVEDDIVDAASVERTLKDLNITNPLIHLNNGKEALEYLRNTNNQRPSLILLDLNMPVMNGLEFLKIIKADDTLKKLPVVVLTTSGDSQDKDESFNYSVAGYIVKPPSHKQFVEAFKTIELYWTRSELPS